MLSEKFFDLCSSFKKRSFVRAYAIAVMKAFSLVLFAFIATQIGAIICQKNVVMSVDYFNFTKPIETYCSMDTPGQMLNNITSCFFAFALGHVALLNVHPACDGEVQFFTRIRLNTVDGSMEMSGSRQCNEYVPCTQVNPNLYKCVNGVGQSYDVYVSYY